MEIKYQARHPVQFTERLLRNIGKISNKAVIVIRDWWTAVELAKDNRVLFITDSADARDLFEQVVCRNRAFGNDDEVLFINNWQIDMLFSEESDGKTKKQKRKTWEEILSKCEKDWPMKFDCCIMNPPYGNLHLKVLEQVLKVADKVINISPVRWLQDPFAPYLKKSDYNKFEKSVSKHIKDIQFIPAKEATELFGDASFTMNLGIYELDANGGWNYQHNDPLVNKIVKKTMQSSWAQHAYTKKYKKNLHPYQMNVSGIHSATAKNPLLCNTYNAQLQTKAPNMKSHNACNSCLFDFATENERKNFYDCYNTPFIAWMCTWWRVDVHINSIKVPYFGNYTHKWKLRDFFDWFDLTQAERTRVVKEIRDMRHVRFH